MVFHQHNIDINYRYKKNLLRIGIAETRPPSLEFPNGELRDVGGHYKISIINENEYDLKRKKSYE